MDVRSAFESILQTEQQRICANYNSDDLLTPLIEIIRTLDYHTFILSHDIGIRDQELLLQKYRYGWSLAFKEFYRNFELPDNIPLFSASAEVRKWIDQITQYSGAIQIASQHLDYCKAGLMSVSTHDQRHFIFRNHFNGAGLEWFERLSLSYYLATVEASLNEKTKRLFSGLESVRLKLKEIVNVAFEKYIQYDSTEEFDEFYSNFGYLYMHTSQVIDDFSEDDVFGGIAYKKYLNHVEYACRAAIMHRDCCMALASKTADKIYLRDILSYQFLKNKFCKSLSIYFDESLEVINQTIDCITLHKNNYDYHLASPGAPAAPYFQIGNDTLVRSTSGCLDKPVFFLNRELKRKYPSEYFEAVNRRELRFRIQLYGLFPNSVVRINENIVIKSKSGDTDIDAVLFDRSTSTLALIQLKWQDAFSTSMKERFSRMTNMIPKSVEWIDKLDAWLSANGSKEIFETLRIKPVMDEIKSVRYFVIARNHVHFTGRELDSRATWCSWFQILEAVRSTPLKSDDPINDFNERINLLSPVQRSKKIKLPTSSFDLKFGKFRITVS